MQRLPARARCPLRAISHDALTGLVKAPGLLDIEVQVLAWRCALLAPHGYSILQQRQAKDTSGFAGTCYSTSGHSHSFGNGFVGEALRALQCYHALNLEGVTAPWARMRS